MVVIGSIFLARFPFTNAGLHRKGIALKIADKLAVPALLLAGGMVYAAEEFNLPYLIPLAMGLFGLFAVILGIETFASGRSEMFDRLYSRREHFSGVPARLFGVLIFLFGVGVALYAFFEWTQPGVAGKFLASLVQTNRGRGVLAIVFGFFTLLFGVIRLIAGSAHSKEERRVLIDINFRVWGVINLIVGMLLLGVGVWFIFL